MASANRSRVIGVTYQDTKGKDGVLLNDPQIKVKLLDNGGSPASYSKIRKTVKRPV